MAMLLSYMMTQGREWKARGATYMDFADIANRTRHIVMKVRRSWRRGGDDGRHAGAGEEELEESVQPEGGAEAHDDVSLYYRR